MGGAGERQARGRRRQGRPDGWRGSDTLIGGAGADKLNGGPAGQDDTYVDDKGTTDTGDDTTEQHTDWVDYRDSAEGVKIDLDATGQRKMLSGGSAEGDTAEPNTIEAWAGSDHGDNMFG